MSDRTADLLGMIACLGRGIDPRNLNTHEGIETEARLHGGMDKLFEAAAAPTPRRMVVSETVVPTLVVTSVDELVRCGMITPGLATQLAPEITE